MVFSYLRNEELKTCMQNLKITRIETKGNWELITFTKQKLKKNKILNILNTYLKKTCVCVKV